VEFHSPNRWNRLRLTAADMPGHVRFIDASGHVAQSPDFELSGAGPTIWTDTGAQVGTSAVYDWASRRWSVD